VTLEGLQYLGVDSSRIVPVWNKADLAPRAIPFGGIAISARTGEGILELEREISARRRPTDELVHARYGSPVKLGIEEWRAEKTRGGTVKLPPMPELPRRRSS
jgi:50S ribosomal subunit-associated GTPase HflX